MQRSRQTLCRARRAAGAGRPAGEARQRSESSSRLARQRDQPGDDRAGRGQAERGAGRLFLGVGGRRIDLRLDLVDHRRRPGRAPSSACRRPTRRRCRPPRRALRRVERVVARFERAERRRASGSRRGRRRRAAASPSSDVERPCSGRCRRGRARRRGSRPSPSDRPTRRAAASARADDQGEQAHQRRAGRRRDQQRLGRLLAGVGRDRGDAAAGSAGRPRRPARAASAPPSCCRCCRRRRRTLWRRWRCWWPWRSRGRGERRSVALNRNVISAPACGMWDKPAAAGKTLPTAPAAL